MLKRLLLYLLLAIFLLYLSCYYFFLSAAGFSPAIVGKPAIDVLGLKIFGLTTFKYWILHTWHTPGFYEKWGNGLQVMIPGALFVVCVFILEKASGQHKKKPKTIKNRGFERLTEEQFSRVARRNAKDGPGILLHPTIPWSLKGETEGTFICGSTGSGKTSSIINFMVKQAYERGDKVVVFDYKGDFTTAFHGLSDVHLFAPWDSRSISWDISRDVRNTLDTDGFAKAALPNKEQDAQPFFRVASRKCLHAAISALINQNRLNWPDLFGLVNNKKVLMDILRRYPSGLQALATLDGAAEQAAGVLGELNSSTQWLALLARAWPEPNFSLRHWMSADQGGMLIMQYSQQFPEFSGSIMSLATYVLISEMLCFDPDAGRYWFFLDEFGNLPKITNLVEGVTTGRDRGARFVLATQDFNQLYKNYGQYDAKTLINNSNTMISFRLNDADTARYVSSCLGAKQEQIYTTFGASENVQTRRVLDSSNTASQNVSLRETSLVMEGELMELRPGTGFLKIAGVGVAKLVWQMTKFTGNALPRLFAPWISEKENPLPEEETKLDEETIAEKQDNDLSDVPLIRF